MPTPSSSSERGLSLQERSTRCRLFDRLCLSFLFFLVFVPSSQAQMTTFGTHTFPETPQSGSVFLVRLYGLDCDNFWSSEPLDRTVSVSGSTITVTIRYSPPFSSTGCNFTAPYLVSRSVGPFAAGQYTLVVSGVDPLSGDPTLEESIELTIAQSVAPRVVPASSQLVLVLMSAMLGLVGLATVRHRMTARR